MSLARKLISDEEWVLFEASMRAVRHPNRRRPSNHHIVIEGIFWIARTGAAWRDLPEEFGKWSSVYRQFRRWKLAGLWEDILDALNYAGIAPDTLQMLDNTAIRAHYHAAGANGGPQKETLGRSRGGFTTKIHLRVNGAGLPMSTVITPEQDSDYIGYDLVMADNLLQPAVLVADRGYDTDKIREDIENRNALPFVGKTVLRTVFRPFSLPMRKNRKVRKVIYTLRNMVERCFNKLKNSRRLATGYNETTDSFLCFIDIACIRLGRRHLSK
ncbi:IS5 family transposase [Paracoccus caeni]|uniref:IS5 family transposase n=1 Tax=Paracoccus caeni TaxID=657651 RepID=A0A934VYS9_9RHOB|nr:IS5 family transposase [Paracoccus caeni]